MSKSLRFFRRLVIRPGGFGGGPGAILGQVVAAQVAVPVAVQGLEDQVHLEHLEHQEALGDLVHQVSGLRAPANIA